MAGAQQKMAALLDGSRWGVPSGKVATAHILERPLAHLNGTTENELPAYSLPYGLG